VNNTESKIRVDIDVGLQPHLRYYGKQVALFIAKIIALLLNNSNMVVDYMNIFQYPMKESPFLLTYHLLHAILLSHTIGFLLIKLS